MIKDTINWNKIFKESKPQKTPKIQCQALTQSGNQCKHNALEKLKYCKRHNVYIKPIIPEQESDSKPLLCPN